MAFRATLARLYRGEVSADIVGRPKIWYSLSGLLLVFSIAGLLIMGLNFGVDCRWGRTAKGNLRPGAAPNGTLVVR